MTGPGNRPDEMREWTDQLAANARTIAANGRGVTRWPWPRPLAARRAVLRNQELLAVNQMLLLAMVTTRQPWRPE